MSHYDFNLHLHDESCIEHFYMCLLPIYTSLCVCDMSIYVCANFLGGKVFCLFVFDLPENFIWHCDYFLPIYFLISRNFLFSRLTYQVFSSMVSAFCVPRNICLCQVTKIICYAFF